MAFKIVSLILIVATCHSHPYGPHGSLSSPSKGRVQELDRVSLGHSASLDGLGGNKDIVGGQKGEVTGESSPGGYGGFDNKDVGVGYSNKDIDGGMIGVDLGHGTRLDGPVGGYGSKDMEGGTGALVGTSFVPISTQGGYNGQRGNKGLTGSHGGSLDEIAGGYNGDKNMVGRGDIGGYSITSSSSHGGYESKDGSNIGGGNSGSIDGFGKGHGNKDIIEGQNDRYNFGSTASEGTYTGDRGMEEGIREISYGNDGLIAVDGGGKDLVHGRGDIAGYNGGSQGGKNKIPGQGASGEHSFIPVMKPGGYRGQDDRGFDDDGSSQGGYWSHIREQSSGGYSQGTIGGGYGGKQQKNRGSSHRGFSRSHGSSQGEIVSGNYGGVREQRGFDCNGGSGNGNHGHIGSGNGGHRTHGGYGSGGYSHGY